ncbi:MAG: hypothetical protein ACR2PV_02315 [Gammaproteobacteria bacterium]
MEMLSKQEFWLSIGFLLMGIITVCTAFHLGKHIYNRCISLKRIYCAMHNNSRCSQDLSDIIQHYFSEKSSFWQNYTQVMVAIMIIVVVGVLLITKTIESDAGLPIITAVGGFALAKGGSIIKQRNKPRDR